MARHDVYDLPIYIRNAICSWCACTRVVAVDPDGTKYCGKCLHYQTPSSKED